jgi:hypothetical protein
MTGHEHHALQQHLNLMRGEPIIPLTGKKAIDQAYRLRMKGLEYSSIATVMGVYHGEWYTRERWREQCRKLGAPPRPRRTRAQIAEDASR